MLEAFESWDLTRPQVPKRSLLHPLEPIGVGTPFVEALTSYIARLADVHAVTVSDLAGYVLAACANRDAPIISERARLYRMGSGFRPGTHAINGLGEDALRWIGAAETATDRTGLRFLTLTPLKQVFCKQSLFRKVQAWCPVCFADWRRKDLPLYLPLLWHLRMVSICEKHGCPLIEKCQHCDRHFGPLFAQAKPGYCSRCRRWLGQSALPPQEQVHEQFHVHQIRIATCVGDVLASMPQLDESHLREILRENITALVTAAAGGNQRVFCDLTGSPGTGVCGWLAGKQLPRPDLLFQICSRLRIQASKVLRRNAAWEIPSEVAAAGIAGSRRGAWRDDPEKIKTELKHALDEEPPPSLNDVAVRLNYRTCAPLRRLDPRTCEQIALRYRAYRRRRHNTWAVRDRNCSTQEIEKILLESLGHERPIPVSQIAAELGYESACPLRMHFPELCGTIARKQAQNRETWRERLRTALVNAISEGPPPPTACLAQRLGCSHGALTYYFPDLCRQLLDSRKEWEAKEREAIRQRIEALATEMKGASVPVVCRAAAIKQQSLLHKFPVLYRQIVSSYLESRDALRHQRRETLRNDVRNAVVDLSRRGMRPTLGSVSPLISAAAAKDWKLIHQEIDRSMRELGCGFGSITLPNGKVMG